MNQIDQWLAQSDEWMPYILPAAGFLSGALVTWITMGVSHRLKVSRLEERLTTALDGTDEARQRLAISQREIDTHRANESRLLLEQAELEKQLKLERQRNEEGLANVFSEPKKLANTLKLSEADEETVRDVMKNRVKMADEIQPLGDAPKKAATENKTPAKGGSTLPSAAKDAAGFMPATPLPQSGPSASASLKAISTPMPSAIPASPPSPKMNESQFEGFEADQSQDDSQSPTPTLPDPKGAAEELRRALKQ